jgi:predicted MFS family arabinose efflux permease
LVDWQNVPSIGDVGVIDWLSKALGTSKKGADAYAAERYIFLVAGVASFILASISPMLPHTPPKPVAAGEGSLAWLKAAKLLKHPFVAVLFLVTFIDAAVHQSFFLYTAPFLKDDVGIPANWVTPVMKIGQIAEILTMLILGYVLKTLGWRTTLIIGVLGHSARFAVFAFYPHKEAAILINAVHGICYAFFFATVYIFVDEFFPKDVRSSAQGLFNVLILGFAPFAANVICGELGTYFTVGDKKNYSILFEFSMCAGLAAAVILFLFFHPPKGKLSKMPLSTPEEEAPPVA